MAIMNNVCKYVIDTLIEKDIGFSLYEGDQDDGRMAIVIQTSDSCWTPILYTSYESVEMDKLFADYDEVMHFALIRGYKVLRKGKGKNFDCGEFFGSSYRDNHTTAKAVASFLVALANYQEGGTLRRADYW